MTTPAITPQVDPFAEFGGAASSSAPVSTSPQAASTPRVQSQADPFAEFGGSVTPPTGTIPSDRTSLGILGSVNTERLHNLGQGIQETGQDVWGAIKGLATAPPPGVSELHEGIQEAIPSFHAYENARSQGKGVWESIKAANDEMARQQAARDVLKQRIDEFKKNPQVASIRAIGDAAAMAAAAYGGAKLGAPEAGTTFDTETGNLVAPTTEAAAVPKPGIVNTVKNVAKQVVQGEKVAQPGAQTALRNAPQAAETEAAARPNIVMEDTKPAMMKVDAEGNPIEVDGQHRAAQLVNAGKGDQPFTIQYTDAAGKTTEQEITADQFLKRINRTPEDILATDEQQSAVRAGNGQPRPPVTKPVAKAPTAEAPKAVPAGIRTTLESPIKTIEAKGQGIYRQLDEASGGQFQKYSTAVDKINKRLDTLIEGVDDDQIEKLEQQKSEIETSQNQMFENLKETKGVDESAVDTANAHWKQARALEDLDRKVFKNPNIVKGNLKYGTPETVNIDPAVKALQKMQDDTRFGGSRLEQALGEKGADDLLNDLYKAQREGVHAMKARQWVKYLAIAGGIAGLGGKLLPHAQAAASVIP